MGLEFEYGPTSAVIHQFDEELKGRNRFQAEIVSHWNVNLGS